jgi:pimeloyl-ACP methyl ester carboxylesterase
MSTDPSLFKTKEAEAAYFSLYERVLSLWPVDHEPLNIPTSLGTTQLNLAGSSTNPPLLLFPGFGSNSTQYWPNISILANQCRVYAIDTVGQPGRSIPTGVLSPSNCDSWIDEIVSALTIQSAYMMGLSLGGWLSLHYAINRPKRTRKVILIDPAATFLPMSRAFFLRSIIPFMIRPTRKGVIKFFNWLTRGYAVNPDYGEMMVQGILNARHPPLRAFPFSEAELRSLSNPVLLVVGEKSLIYDPRKAIERARRFVANLEVETIPNGSHALNMEQAEAVNHRVSAFLAR